jgi:cellulose synthase/poly-beta-1,6-N-acetylglucosamine synthase-like glycosyltransferase
MTVGLVVINHNYREFVCEAVESCLGQNYPNCRVLVVDDGSTDGSLDVVAQFAGEAQIITGSRGGQASAINVAVASVHTDVYLFLDSDDLLDPAVVERVVDAFQRDPAAGRVQFHLEYCDPSGSRLGRFAPTRFQPLAEADRSRAVLEHNDDLSWSPMSGNAFRASTLRAVLPIPDAYYPEIGADMYLTNTTALIAPVVSMDWVGGRYRLHDRNWHVRIRHTAELSTRTLALSRATHVHLEQVARRMGLTLPDGGVGSRSLTFRAHEVIETMASETFQVQRRKHLTRLAASGAWTALRRQDRPWSIRLMYAAWFIAMAMVPRAGAGWVVERLFPPLVNPRRAAR